MNDLGELHRLAREIAQEAGQLAALRRAEGVTIAASKATIADIVTEADREVEAVVRSRIAEARPGDGFLGEESGSADSETGLTWVVDPIDGTVNYAFGMPTYAVSIAVVEGSDPATWQPLVGVVYAPALDELFEATLGGGAWLKGERLRVGTDVSAGALISTGFGYDPASHESDLALVHQMMPLARDLRRLGAASIDLSYVAMGRLDAYVERGLKPWDYAAGALIVTEAGGQIGWHAPDEAGRPMIVAGGPAIFDTLYERTTPAS